MHRLPRAATADQKLQIARRLVVVAQPVSIFESVDVEAVPPFNSFKIPPQAAGKNPGSLFVYGWIVANA
jgi:hypothetical protein